MFNTKFSNPFLAGSILITLCSSLLLGCGGSSSSNKNSNNNTNSENGTTTPTITGNECFSSNSLGISKLPDTSSALYKTTFCKYLSLPTPSGKAINFYAQQKVSDEQLVRAQRILGFYLQGKEAVANRMADNNAHMMLLNGSDGDIELADGLQGQPLYEKEMIVEGSAGYLSSDLETYRDASYEEILHLMHDYGIGTETQPGADRIYSQQIKTARENAMTQNLWPSSGVSQETRNWIEELRKEGSLSQEYLASVLDSYYGLWQVFDKPGGMWGIYTAKNRAEVKTKDPLGFAAMEAFFQPNLTYMARIDASFEGSFYMSLDNNKTYTYKSQYLTNARLTGNKNSNLFANNLDNQLAGNSGNNIIDGKEGSDLLLLQGKRADYSLQKNSRGILIQDTISQRDGTIEIRNIENIKFSDGVIATTSL